jgi:thioredoxin-like negative regulator of GroEL
MRTRILLLAALVTTAGSAAAADTRLKDYVALSEAYRRGDSALAVDAIAGWKSADLSAVVRALKRGRHAEWRPPKDVVAALANLPAAIMLHTEAGLRLDWQERTSDAWRHWLVAEELAGIDPVTDRHREFLRSWYRTFAVYCLGTYRLRDAMIVIEQGRARFPDDASLALLLGQAYEVRGTYPTKRGVEAMEDLAAAERLFRGIAVRNPDLSIARVRLGRVLARGNEGEAALAEFERAGAAADARVRYLAHLFAGDVRRRRSQVPEAAEQFRQALDAWPGGQAAALSLAETLHSGGHFAQAAEVLAGGLQGSATSAGDPAETYDFGDRAEHKKLLEDLKKAVQSPQ